MRGTHRIRVAVHRGLVGEFRVAICAIAVCASARAAAQPSQSIAQAEQLFEQARELAAKGEFGAACPVFEASYKLDPALGTLLNMATCYENDGKLASAWGRYREVISVATKVGDEARIKIAREKSAALEPRLPRLTIRAATKISGLAVMRDDVPVDPAVLGAGIYVDPGAHVVSATAPKHRSVSIEVTMVEAETKIVEIPALEPLPDAPSVTGASTQTVIHVAAEEDPGKNRRIVGIVLGGTGAAAIAVGLGFGVSARSSWNSAFDDGLCDKETKLCNREGQERTNDARRNALVADVVAGLGIGMIATGAILYFTAPKKRKDVSVAPVAGGAAVTIGGTW